jgi:hypothetical protein
MIEPAEFDLKGGTMTELRQDERRTVHDLFIVRNEKTGETIGRPVNLSMRGAMLVSNEPMRVKSVLSCY